MIKTETPNKKQNKLIYFIITLITLFSLSYLIKNYIVDTNFKFFKTELEKYNEEVEKLIIKKDNNKKFVSLIFDNENKHKNIKNDYDITLNYFNNNLKKELINIDEITYVNNKKEISNIDYYSKNYFKIKDNERTFILNDKYNSYDLDFIFINDKIYFNNDNLIKTLKFNLIKNFDKKLLSKIEYEALNEKYILEIQDIDFYDETLDKSGYKIKTFNIDTNYFDSKKGLIISIGSDYFKNYMLDFTLENIKEQLNKIKKDNF